MTTTFTAAARQAALAAHRNQRYGRGAIPIPYEVHLGHVIGVLHRFGYGDDGDLIAAAWLHDIVEDTTFFGKGEAARSNITYALNPHIADLVMLVTDGEGNRKERRASLYARMTAETRLYVRNTATILKLADRIANVEASVLGSDARLLGMYVDEYPEFRANLRGLGDDAMWTRLDVLMGFDARPAVTVPAALADD
jgi:(p)ppGpp synthase/HD superfamily hydrolase